MKNFEKSICIALNNLASNNKVIFYIFRSITYTGEWWMYVVYGIIITIIDYHKGYEALQMGLIAYGMHYPIYFLIKNMSKRNRPFEKYENIKALVKPPDKYSLPSGHSSASTISALIIVSVFGSMELLIIWPITVGLSRVVLGMHYPSDSIIGIILGYMCYYVSALILI
tara:strand:- start:246 stop:752 length:507 start_codon:yes stop_codon:yes gene_type:complete